jgi:hypothetical protein
LIAAVRGGGGGGRGSPSGPYSSFFVLFLGAVAGFFFGVAFLLGGVVFCFFAAGPAVSSMGAAFGFFAAGSTESFVGVALRLSAVVFFAAVPCFALAS